MVDQGCILASLEIAAVAMQVFHLPATRLPWYWLGIRSIDKKTFHSLLAAGNSVCLIPGGVSECMVMQKGNGSAAMLWLCSHEHIDSTCLVASESQMRDVCQRE